MMHRLAYRSFWPMLACLTCFGAVTACDSSTSAGRSGEPTSDASPQDASDVGEDALSDSDSPDAATDAAPDRDADASSDDIPEYPLSARPYTTLQGLWAPAPLSEQANAAFSSGELEITDIDRFEEYGIGVEFIEGQPWVEHNELAPGFVPVDDADRRSLLYFWESADPQMIDEESPIRFEGTTIAPMGSTYRPHSHLIAQVYEAQVRSARRISEASGRPFDLAFIAGDLTDGGQENELGWTIDILAGGVIDPDSGIDDDPIPGPGNDFADPFRSVGIGSPWYPAVGNHETLYMGAFPATDSVQAAAVGDEVLDFTDDVPLLRHVDGASNGFRDASTPFADVVTEGTTPADPARRILDLGEVLGALHSGGGEPEGHGLTPTHVLEERGYYSFHPVAGRPIRFIVLDTVMKGVANAMGGMERDQFDWLERELRRARNARELVIVGSHHKTSALAPNSIVKGGELRELLASYDNVILHVAGHGHKNTKELVRPGDSHDPEQGYWEIMCSSTVDFPMQSRIIELVWEGDDYLSVYVTNMEQNAAEDTMAHRALDLAAGRKYFTDRSYLESWQEQLDVMNLLLRFKLPGPVADEISSKDWPERIESLQTLQAFEGP
ncbi:MAG: hypothetical protein ACOC9J_01740 [Persicimonas sp.]